MVSMTLVCNFILLLKYVLLLSGVLFMSGLKHALVITLVVGFVEVKPMSFTREPFSLSLSHHEHFQLHKHFQPPNHIKNCLTSLTTANHINCHFMCKSSYSSHNLCRRSKQRLYFSRTNHVHTLLLMFTTDLEWQTHSEHMLQVCHIYHMSTWCPLFLTTKVLPIPLKNSFRNNLKSNYIGPTYLTTFQIMKRMAIERKERNKETKLEWSTHNSRGCCEPYCGGATHMSTWHIECWILIIASFIRAHPKTWGMNLGR